MKHLLNDLSNEEKNRIREQHEGGMKIDTSKFKKLVETRLGDTKPLISESEEQFVLVDTDETDADIVNMCVDATEADLTAAGLSASDRKRKHKKCNAGKIKRAGRGKAVKYSGRPWP